MQAIGHGCRGAALATLLLAGCYSYPYASPYQGTYGPSYGPSYSPGYGPGSPIPQGGSVMPGGTYVPQNPGLSVPSNSGSPTPLPGNPNGTVPTWRPDSSSTPGDAPPFRNDNPVPNPRDEPGFGDPLGTSIAPNSLPDVAQSGALPMETAAVESDPFESPVTQVSASSEPTPYAHDEKGYTFLRGVVDYDEEDRTWAIVYSDNPAPSDQYGGSLVFAPATALKELQSGDVVLVKGQIDPGAKDRFGKPMYRVSTLQQLEPLK